ncbi:MAG: GntR family transcriptional regulator, partial [Phycisphaerae bacterium]|nr:GntR family transcriptional regulator [Phycisphaerae bacterium]
MDAAAIGHNHERGPARDDVAAAFSLPAVDGDDPRPKYVQARDILVNAIRSNHLRAGAKLPSTQEISEQIKISLITAHRALQELVEHGFLRREVGRGTFVREDVQVEGKQRRLSIALMLGRSINLEDYYHSTIIASLRRVAEADVPRVEFFFQDRYELHARGNSSVGAICIHPPLEAQADVEKLARQHPVVLLGGSFPGGRLPRVDCDNFAGARKAV